MNILGSTYPPRLHPITSLCAYVRSIWLAKVELNKWASEHETLARKLVQPEGVLEELALDVFLPLHHRALIAAGLLKE